MPFVDAADGTRMYYAEWGTGTPLVLIHGWAMGADMWEYQIPELTANGVRCVVYDQRGCGRSDQPSTGYEFDTLADDLALLLRHLDLRNVTLVGWSSGGGVLTRYFARHGAERVARSVLISANPPFLLKAENNREGLDKSLVYDPFTAGLLHDRPQLLADGTTAFFGIGQPGVSASPEIIRWAIGLWHRSSAQGMLQLFKAVHETDFRDDMRAFMISTLIIHGSADPFLPLEATSSRTHRAIRGSRLEVYKGVSHGLFYTHRKQLNADLIAFVTSEMRHSVRCQL
jgi:non-heme chloroperoxidase